MKRIISVFLFTVCAFALSVSSFAADKSDLKSLLNDLQNPALYTAETYQPYQSALNRAVKLYESSDATQEEIDKATRELKSARDGLVFILNRKSLLDFAEEIDGYLYGISYNLSEETKAILTEARKEFLNLYEDPNLTQEQINGAQKTYENAVKTAEGEKEIQKFSVEDASDDVIVPSRVISSSSGLGQVTAIRLVLISIGFVFILFGIIASALYFKPPKFFK